MVRRRTFGDELRVAKRNRWCQGRLPPARVKVASTGLDDGENCPGKPSVQRPIISVMFVSDS